MVRFGSTLRLCAALCLLPFLLGAEEFLTVRAECRPRVLRPGEEGTLRLSIVPRSDSDIRIAGQPELIVRLDDQPALIFNKAFFTASELDFPSRSENGLVLLTLGKEVSIPFRMAESPPTGTCRLSGEIIFTGVFSDGWSMKTFQRFSATPVRSRKGGS